MKMEHTNDAEIILLAEHVSNSDAMCQLAEEASELAQAALKLRRAVLQGNPTPISMKEAIAGLNEEFADVIVATLVLGAKGFIDVDEVEAVEAKKQTRWLARVLSKVTSDV
ncbi:MAG: hypothetical protein Q4F79_12460 [Eubacteriales bacterium]|nr:hypothetical protein [Eubacteriales bacterium]